MPDLTLGSTPPRLTVWLVDAAPFAGSVTADNPFPTAPELVFDTGTVWPATLDAESTTAAWLHPAADVEALAALGPRRVTLRDPGSHHVWAHGTVYVARVVDNGDASTVEPGGSITVDTLDGNVSITYSGGGGAGTSDHSLLTNRSLADQHPIGAVTGLQAELDGKAATTHTHDDRYYTEGEVDTALAGKAATSHTHPVTDLTATGTADATTYLRGDGAWATPEGGGPLTGTGFPEGVVTAPVGTEYVDTAATNGAIKWIKASGTGNTGWRVVYGDTGWRIVDGDANLATGKINIRRINAHVHFFLGAGQYGLWSYTGAVNATVGLGYVPAGFVPPSTAFGIGRADSSKAIVGAIEVQTGATGYVQARGFSQTNSLQADLAIWLTSQSWPTALPGTAG